MDALSKATLPIELKGASADLDELERWLEDRYDRADDGENPEVGFLATVQRVKRTLESAARKVSE